MVSLLKNTHPIITNKKVVPICKNSLGEGKRVFSAIIEVVYFLLVFKINDGRKRIE
ncbi:MAG: Uncharacterised protein [Bacteroidetes bacterium MED-G17]|nr:MAG: Uncharacterised protein [Bacteroidetes bacterium MED-G17]